MSCSKLPPTASHHLIVDSAQRPEDSQGRQFLLTSAHCDEGDARSWTTGGGAGIGSAFIWGQEHDFMILGPTSAGGYIYGGAAYNNPGGQYVAKVHGWTATQVNDMMCTSGSFSGSLCNIKATQTGMTIQMRFPDGTVWTVDGVVQAEQQAHTNAGGNGDSGSPVFSFDSQAAALGRGTLSAIDPSTSTSCTGIPAGGGRSCAWRIFFPDITYQLKDAGNAGLITTI